MLPENQPQIEPTETPQTDTDVSLTSAEPTPEEMRKFWRWQRQQELAEDEKLRQDPYLRLYAAWVIPQIQQLLFDAAGMMKVHRAKDAGENIGATKNSGYFATDAAAELLLWQVNEFLQQALIDRHDEVYEAEAKILQLDLDRAADFYNLYEHEGDLLPYNTDLFDKKAKPRLSVY